MKELLSITSLENLTVKSLHDAFVKLVEIPFDERLMRLFQFVDSNADAEITYQEVLRLFSLLYWQESCCFVTGKLCSSKGYLLCSLPIVVPTSFNRGIRSVLALLRTSAFATSARSTLSCFG